jgi:uncharacterized membrane protein
MSMLILGLVLFLGVHSTRIVADGWRTRQLARLGEPAWKGIYSVVSLLGFVLIVWGYGLARQQPVVLWQPLPAGVRHLASLLTLFAFVLLAAAYVPGNGIKSRLHHPMVLGVKTWAIAHLLANNTLADLLLFGGFLVWGVFSFRAARARDRAQGTVYPAGKATASAIAVVVGVAAWAGFAFWAHAAWIGVRPFGA